MPVIIDTGVDNAGLRTGLLQAESMVDASVKRITVKMNAAGKLTGASMVFAPAATQQLEKNVGLLGLAATRMQKLQTVSSGLNSVLGRMTGIFSSGLGISAAIGGLALLGTAFSKAITMAQRFQTAQISIGAILLSTYKVKDKSGQEAGGPAGFMYAHEQALKYNQQIIVRSRKNILTYEEQLKAFQVGLAAGGRKGIQPQMVMDISEQIAVGAKAIGLQGERIGEQVRILLGGGVNVQRSMFAKILGITSKDISSRSGEDLVKFIQSRMKGFSTKGVLDEFNNSIEAIITTMTSQIDVFLATVGTKVMKKLTPVLRGFGEFLQGPDAAKLGDTLVTGFTNVFTAIETLARSPAIPIIEKVVTFLANEADKIIIGAVLLRLVGVFFSLAAGVSSAIGWFNKLGLSAAVAAGEVQGLALATGEVGVAGVRGVGGFGLKGAAGAGGALAGARSGMTAEQLATRLAGREGMIAGGREALLAEYGAGAAAVGGVGLLGRAKGAVGRAGGWLKDGRGAAMAGRVGKGLMTGALTYGGIKIGADMAGMGDYDKPSGVYSDMFARIAGGAVLGYQIGGVGGAVVGGSIGGATEVGTLYSQKVAADNQAGTNLLTSRTGLAQKTKALEEARDKALQNAKPNRAGVMDAGLQESTTRYWNAEAQRRQGQIDALPKQAAAEAEAKRKADFEKDPKNKGLRFVTDTERNDMAKAIAQSQSTAQQVAEGTGPLRQKQKAYWEFNTKALNLRKSIMEGDIKLVDADLIAKNDEVVKRRASLDNANSDNFNPAQQKRLRMFNTQQEDLKRRQGERYIKEARGGMTDTQADIARQRKEMMESGGIDTLQTQYTKGRRAIESQTKTDSLILGADTGAVLKKRLHDFDTVFDMRGKKIAQQIAGLGLGVGSENVVQATKLAFDKAMADIDQALATHAITAAEALKMRAQQKQKNIADQITNAYNEPRRLGLVDAAKSENVQKGFAEKALMAGASGKTPSTEATYKGLADIESWSTKLKPADFERYKAAATDKLRRDTVERADDLKQQYNEAVAQRAQAGIQRALEREQRPVQNELDKMQVGQAQMGVGDAQLGAQGARYSAHMFEAGLNPRNARVMQRAQTIVGREQGRIGLDEAIGLVREGIAIQRKSNAAAILKADSDITTAQLNLQLAETQAKYMPALQASADAIQGIAWSALNDGVNKLAEAMSNGAGDVRGAISAIDQYNKKPATGDAASADERTNGGPNFNIDVGPGFTEKDIDAWMPKIREKLCKLAQNSGSRG